MSNQAELTVRAVSDGPRPPRPSVPRIRLVPLAAALLCALVAAGCAGPSGSTPSASPNPTGTAPSASGETASAAVCAQARKLQGSLGALRDIDLRTTDVSGVEDAVARVRTDLDGLESAASAGWRPQIKALSTALSALGTAIRNLGASATSSPSVDGITTAAMSVATSAEALRSKIAASCPGQ